MNLVDDRGDKLVTVFPSTINVERLITIPIEIREYFKNEHNLELKIGAMVQLKIKNGSKETSHFPRKITSGYRIRIPPEFVKFYNFVKGESVQVELTINKPNN